MEMEKIIEGARKLALVEIDKYGTPKLEHFEISLKKGVELANKLSADVNIVILGVMLMDLKIGECLVANKLSEHIGRSAEAAKLFLQTFKLEKEVFDKIIGCITSHHGAKPYPSLEAEICANADCYRFLSPAGALNYIAMLGKRGVEYEEILKQLEAKMDEKYGIISLDICKKECAEFYREFKDLLIRARAII